MEEREMDPLKEFEEQRRTSIAAQAVDKTMRTATRTWFDRSLELRYSYNFTWMGVPIIQYPQDIVAIQEVIWRVRPDLIVETGVAHGGSLMLSASMLELLGGEGMVVGVDVDIRPHNREVIEGHLLKKRITLIEGSSVGSNVVQQVKTLAEGKERILVILDSNHTHEHVAEELRLYSPLVRKDGYLLVFDTVIEDTPAAGNPGRPWGPGNNPKTAVREFLRSNDRFVVDQELENKLMVTVAPGGYLRCVRD
jgi:cephalosporin hydroxylase